RGLAGQLMDAAVVATDAVPARRSLPSSVQTIRREPPAIRFERDARIVVDDPNGANDPHTARMLPAAARPFQQLVLLDSKRIGDLERLDRRVLRVRHRGLHAVLPGPHGPSALSAGDGLDVGIRTSGAWVEAADPDEVHRALARRGNAIRRELGER